MPQTSNIMNSTSTNFSDNYEVKEELGKLVFSQFLKAASRRACSVTKQIIAILFHFENSESDSAFWTNETTLTSQLHIVKILEVHSQ